MELVCKWLRALQIQSQILQKLLFVQALSYCVLRTNLQQSLKLQTQSYFPTHKPYEFCQLFDTKKIFSELNN